MRQMDIAGDNSLFVLLSFEGPDPYSLAGGLGTRIANLSQALAGMGFPTHLFFVGDPRLSGEEFMSEEKLILHRWCQWISEYYPSGVYHGEGDKVNDYSRSIPPFVIERLVKPALSEDKLVVIQSEEWHTAEAVCQLSEQLRDLGLRDRVVIFWNANNTFGFDRIDWPRLTGNATITTVSRYMKYIMRELGVNPLVIPNGIPEAALIDAGDGAAARLKEQLGADLLLTKVARYDPTKGWLQAVEATARLNRGGRKTVLLARGGIEPFGEEVMLMARQLGLIVKDVWATGQGEQAALDAIGRSGEADVLNFKSHCMPRLLSMLYHSSDAVLANSTHEPFGLVGLETMAAGGVAFTGGTGEDYAIHLHNSIVLETDDPAEIEAYVDYLSGHAEQENGIRSAGRHTARRFVWTEVIRNLIEKTGLQASMQGIPQVPVRTHLLPEAPQSPEPVPAGGPILIPVGV